MSDRQFRKTWAIEPHTEAKHRILASYLNAWFPIVSRGGFPRVIYIDGFAGPGTYADGQHGSPILALRSLAEQKIDLNSRFEFHFVEREPAVVCSLEASLAQLRQRGLIPASAEVHVHQEMKFEEAYETELRPRLLRYPNAPVFALVDPFGWTGMPMRLIRDLLRRPHTEVLVNFMFEEINRFLAHEAQPGNFDALFGGTDWRQCVSLTGVRRTRCIHDYYRDCLHSIGEAKFVRSFEMRNERNLTDYFLFFATNSLKGLAKMKEAMWRVDPGGYFSFSDATDPAQTTLFGKEPDLELLRRLLLERFGGVEANRAQIEAFVVAETPFLASHYKPVLKRLEREGVIEVVQAPSGRKMGTFAAPEIVVRFEKVASPPT